MTTRSTKTLTDDQLRAELSKLCETVAFLESEMHRRGMYSDKRRSIRVEHDHAFHLNTERLAVQARLTDLSAEGIGCILEEDLLVTVDLSDIGITEPVMGRQFRQLHGDCVPVGRIRRHGPAAGDSQRPPGKIRAHDRQPAPGGL